MKDIIVVMGMVILGVFIAVSIVLGTDDDSLKSSAKNLGTKMQEELMFSTDDTTQ